MTALEVKPIDACRWDIVALGEVMLKGGLGRVG